MATEGEARFRERLTDAAIDAELETGRREPTREAARAHVVVRLARMTAGFILLVAGIAAIPLPGPGWLIIAVALGLLARDVAWAERLLQRLRERIPGAQDPSPRVVATGVTLAVAGAGISAWLVLAR